MNINGNIRNTIKRLLAKTVNSEYARKVIVSHFYKTLVCFADLKKSQPTFSSNELLKWQNTLKMKASPFDEFYRANMYYGIESTLRTYARQSKPLKACIEHGVYFGNYVNDSELDRSELSCLVTFSDVRLLHVREVSSVPVCLIGPYIAYATSYLEDRTLRELKKEIGRTMVVFPSHSLEFTSKQYDIDKFIAEIKRVKREMQIDTVLVSLYFLDLKEPVISMYEHCGFKVVTSGIREDANFLRRQRALIELSDFTMSNSVGTHIGYCVYLKKPHYLFNQDVLTSFSVGADACESSKNVQETSRKEKLEIGNYFSTLSYKVTDKQYEICDKYWGFSHVLSPEDIGEIYELSSKSFKFPPPVRQLRFNEMARKHNLSFVY